MQHAAQHEARNTGTNNSCQIKADGCHRYHDSALAYIISCITCHPNKSFVSTDYFLFFAFQQATPQTSFFKGLSAFPHDELLNKPAAQADCSTALRAKIADAYMCFRSTFLYFFLLFHSSPPTLFYN